VILTKRQPRDCRDGIPWNKFLDEGNPAPGSALDIETKVDFFEGLMKWNYNSKNPCPVELERDKADIGAIFERIQFRAGRNELPDQGRLDNIVQKQHIPPLRGQKLSRLLHSSSSHDLIEA